MANPRSEPHGERQATPDSGAKATQEGEAAQEAALDALFFALADPTRRAIIRRLRQAPASVTQLAEPFDMSQPAVSKHIKVLEGAGLVTRSAHRQMRMANLNAEPLRDVAKWLEDFEAFWESNLDALDSLLEDLKLDGRKRNHDL